jgi:uncharacterized protein YyaL (SSP411 family)
MKNLSEPDMALPSENLLRHEASPYLLQHRDNPVHWRAWGPEALAEARETGKPVLLSVGYAACHWCHVMAHESFEDRATAEVMNRLFVNIKVDREERPDVDQIYMAALQATGEQGGWPLTMFLTPDGAPIWGGTYFPKEARFGRPSFVSVLEEVARVFRDQPDLVAGNRDHLLDALRRRQDGDGIAVDRALLDLAAARLLGLVDPVHGGTRGAPKFPQAGFLEFLLRAALRTGDRRYADAVILTLRSLCRGGICDHIGGGFSRYSTDERWLVPHFEKMLYDNAQLLPLLAAGWQLTGDPIFRDTAGRIVTWLQRDMRRQGGAFAASLDADSEGEEGRYYVWTRDEVIGVLWAQDGAFFADAYDIRPGGNWEGRSIPNLLSAPPFDAADTARLDRLRDKLLLHRSARTPPALDDKILADWNGLVIAGLAEAGAVFGRDDWIGLAEGAYRFVMSTMRRDGRLAHACREDRFVFPGLATDHAAMVKAALALHQATFDDGYLADAEALADTIRRHYWNDAEPGYYLSADDAEALIIRPRSVTDEATPSATSLMAQNLVRLWRLTGSDFYRADVDAILEAAGGAIAGNLFATAGLLNALDLRLGAIDVAIVAPPGTDAGAMLRQARDAATPSTVITFRAGDADLPADHPAAGKGAADGRPTAYVCRGETCSLPVTDPAALAALIRPDKVL